MWQISSGYKPFCDVGYDGRLILDILNGKREEIIDGTYVQYSNLYRKCWEDNPSERPDIQNVVSTLKSIISHQQNNSNIEITANEINKNHTIGNHQVDPKSNDKILDINRSLVISDLQNHDSVQNELLYCTSYQEMDINKSLIVSSSQYKTSIHYSLSSISNRITALNTPIDDNNDNIVDNINNKVVDELIKRR
ncbi:unnamed protein product [Rhizophagus irregularis]|nr:unnamed protein product [Rhizophagus irregularis]